MTSRRVTSFVAARREAATFFSDRAERRSNSAANERSFGLARVLCVAALLALPVFGGTITVLNPSFEAPALGSPGAFIGGIPNWSGSGAFGVYRPAVPIEALSVPDGPQVAFILGPGTISQNLGVTALAGQIYQLDVWVGTEINFTGASFSIGLLSGGSVFATLSSSLVQTSPFVHFSVSGTPGADGVLSVQLVSTGGQPLFDLVQVQGPDAAGVPEPATAILLIFGMGTLALTRRLRRRPS